MSRGYRAYIRVTAGDDGKPLGAKGLQPVVANLNAHARAGRENSMGVINDGWGLIPFDPFTVRTHLGKPVIVMHVDEAWHVRVALRVAKAFLERTGWTWTWTINANTRKAL